MSSRALTKYRSRHPAKMSGMTMLFLGAAAVFVVWLIVKKRAASASEQQAKTKTWEIQYNEEGLPVKITKHVSG